MERPVHASGAARRGLDAACALRVGPYGRTGGGGLLNGECGVPSRGAVEPLRRTVGLGAALEGRLEDSCRGPLGSTRDTFVSGREREPRGARAAGDPAGRHADPRIGRTGPRVRELWRPAGAGRCGGAYGARRGSPARDAGALGPPLARPRPAPAPPRAWQGVTDAARPVGSESRATAAAAPVDRGAPGRDGQRACVAARRPASLPRPRPGRLSLGLALGAHRSARGRERSRHEPRPVRAPPQVATSASPAPRRQRLGVSRDVARPGPAPEGRGLSNGGGGGTLPKRRRSLPSPSSLPGAAPPPPAAVRRALGTRRRRRPPRRPPASPALRPRPVAAKAGTGGEIARRKEEDIRGLAAGGGRPRARPGTPRRTGARDGLLRRRGRGRYPRGRTRERETHRHR